jgi:hypothetical protein
MLYSQQKRIISLFLVKTIKTRNIQRRKYKSIDGYCTVPIISLQSAPSIKTCITKEKGELLSLYFNRTKTRRTFLIDEDNVLKIKKAKESLLIWLSRQALQNYWRNRLNLKKLKMGFKQIYGDTVYGFLFDYKMDFAKITWQWIL